MADTRYTEDHEWIRLDGDVATLGITDYAQQQLGDVVFVDLPEVGRQVEAKEAIAVVESVKAASDIYAPLTGEIVETNDGLADDPAKVNADPEDGGWFCKLRVADSSAFAGLMDAEAYKALLETLD
jgi:glycine cleavage system H protein